MFCLLTFYLILMINSVVFTAISDVPIGLFYFLIFYCTIINAPFPPLMFRLL